MLNPLAEGVWVADMPNRFYGLEFGARMTLVRLASGDLLVHSPIAIDDAMQSEIDVLGSVAHIVAPNIYHHIHAKSASELYPRAKVHLAPGLSKKRSDIRVDALLGDGSDPGWGDDFEAIPLRGNMLNETVFVHHPTGTLVCSDLLENFETSDHWFTRVFLKVNGVYGKPGVSFAIRMAYRDRPNARKSIDAILERPFDKIALAHGNPVLQDGRDVLRASYGWLQG